jgi:hypothetical protein
MAFCKEMEEGTATPEQVAALYTKPEWEQARRDWWETDVNCDLDDLQQSVRRLKLVVVIMIVALVVMRVWKW